MIDLLRYRKYAKIFIPLALVLAISGIVLCLIYSRRHWNAGYFETFYAHWDFFVAYCVEAVSILVFFPLFLVFVNSMTSTRRTIGAWISFIVIVLVSIAVVGTVIANCRDVGRVIRDYKLDCQLQSDDQQLFYEAIDALLPSLANVQYDFVEPDRFILKAAREGYPKAQNAMGCFYYERAKIGRMNAEYESQGSIRRRLTSKSDLDFDHALYWFLKAAQNNYAPAQTNLGRIYMGDLASNRCPDMELAKKWLLKSCKNKYPEAFYYLGEIYSNENLRDAYVYWSRGAELGNEDCARALETPEFANGIPVDEDLVNSENGNFVMTF